MWAVWVRFAGRAVGGCTSCLHIDLQRKHLLLPTLLWPLIQDEDGLTLSKISKGTILDDTTFPVGLFTTTFCVTWYMMRRRRERVMR